MTEVDMKKTMVLSLLLLVLTTGFAMADDGLTPGHKMPGQIHVTLIDKMAHLWTNLLGFFN
jgi:hypothetical protein